MRLQDEDIYAVKDRAFALLQNLKITPQTFREFYKSANTYEFFKNNIHFVRSTVYQNYMAMFKDKNLDEQGIIDRIYSETTASYQNKGNTLGPVMRDFEKQILLQIIDNAWKDHLGSVDYLRQGIGLRGYGSRNPKLEFRRESFELFEELLSNIRIEAIRFLARVEIEVNDPEELREMQKSGRKETFEHQKSESAFNSDEPVNTTQQQVSNPQQQGGNRRLRRYEAKMARKKAKN